MTIGANMKPRCGTSKRAIDCVLWAANTIARPSAGSVDQIIEATPPAFFDRSPPVGVDDATPILIGACPLGLNPDGANTLEPSGSRGGRRTGILERRRKFQRRPLGALQATPRLRSD